ncbi:MAG: hypothetical protein E6I11_04440 [Chloroflexi bacterium]|nr:MAG: hypothetical protein E6I11_04440 [Chloroflexota bacterium]
MIGRAAAQFPLGGRKGAWWGVAFVILLLVSAAMVSLPTAAERGDRITAFYKAHQQVIVWQQIIGTLALLPFLAFAAALSRWARMDGRRNRWLMPAAGLVVLATVATSLVAGAMALMPDLSPALAHQLTVIEDLADSVLFASLAGFVLATSTGAPVWVRALAVLVAIASLARAVLSPFGVTVLDVAAPPAVLAFLLLMSGRLLFGPAAGRHSVEAGP